MSTNENKVNKKKKDDKIDITMWIIIAFLIFLISNVVCTFFINDNNILPSFIFSTLQLAVYILIPSFIFPNSKLLKLLMFFIYLIIVSIVAFISPETKFIFISNFAAFLFLFATVYVIEGITTLSTFSALSILSLVFYWILNSQPLLKLSDDQILYISLSLFMTIYIGFGVKINQFFLKNVIQAPIDIYSNYNRETLNIYMNLFYLIVFFLLNVSGIIGEEYGDALNNIFLTGLCLINVDWKEIIKRLPLMEIYKKSCKNVTYEEMERDKNMMMGKRISVKGQIIQVENKHFIIREIEVPVSDSPIIMFEFNTDKIDYNIIENDVVTIWGKSKGSCKYRTAIGQTKLPLIKAEYLKINGNTAG